jgi:hypothetical protein
VKRSQKAIISLEPEKSTHSTSRKQALNALARAFRGLVYSYFSLNELLLWETKFISQHVNYCKLPGMKAT